MSTLIQITMNPGSGKTYSLINMDHKSTFYIDSDGKGLAWAGWRKQYNKENKNYMRTSDLDLIKNVLKKIDSDQKHIKTVVIDTVTTIASDMQMLEMKKASQNDWREYAADIYELYSMASGLRDDLIIVFMAHPQEVVKGDQLIRYTTKFPGKMLTKLNMNGKLNYNLYGVVENEGSTKTYSFITQSDGITEARSTEGVLPYKMPNDLNQVCKLIREKDLLEA